MRSSAWTFAAAALALAAGLAAACGDGAGDSDGAVGGRPPEAGAQEPEAGGRPRRGGPIGGPARTPAEATAAFMAFDADADGVLRGGELPAPFVSLLARADADGDGAASEAEILALMTAEAEPPAER